MKEGPILMSAPMVRAILDDRKTKTRRVLKPQPVEVSPAGESPSIMPGLIRFRKTDPTLSTFGNVCPYGKPGDRLWVRETHAIYEIWHDEKNREEAVTYRADPAKGSQYGCAIGDPFCNGADQCQCKWRPSIFMRRKHSRITLEIVSVGVERLNDISAADALAEGIRPFYSGGDGSVPSCYGLNEVGCGFGKPGSWQFQNTPEEAYRRLWEKINGPGSWKLNPWVWVVEFRRVQ